MSEYELPYILSHALSKIPLVPPTPKLTTFEIYTIWMPFNTNHCFYFDHQCHKEFFFPLIKDNVQNKDVDP